jgi:hypothetical protein
LDSSALLRSSKLLMEEAPFDKSNVGPFDMALRVIVQGDAPHD